MPERPLPRILSAIRATKEKEVALLLAKRSGPEWLSRARERLTTDRPRNFLAAVSAKSAGMRLIAEVKRASPSKGVIRKDFDPAVLAAAYERGGAAAISCLTDATYFQGSLEDLAHVRRASRLPVLRKDFLIHLAQVAEARLAGADAVLLIARMLSLEMLESLLALARELRMTPFTEIHDENDLAKALAVKAPLIGINNRDLETFQVDIETTHRLRPKIPLSIPVVAESGIATPEDMRRLARDGISAALVGESLLRQRDVEAAVRALLSFPI
ncbi:MAG: indole-3-glycerol phosphate synthase TrpC [Planctomycetota bacterium]